MTENKKSLAQSLSDLYKAFTERRNELDRVSPDDVSDLFADQAAPVAEKLGLTPFQSLLFAIAIDHEHSQMNSDLQDIASALGMNYLEFLPHAKDLYALRDRRLLRIKGDGSVSIPQEVTNALVEDRPVRLPSVKGLSTSSIMRQIGTLMSQVDDGDLISPSRLVEEIDLLCRENPETCIGKAYRKCLADNDVPEEERLMFYVLAHLTFSRDRITFDLGDLEDYVKDPVWLDALKMEFDLEMLELQVHKIIVPEKTDGLQASGSFTLREGLREEMFADARKRFFHLNGVSLTDCSDKPVKELFYNAEEQRQVERLYELLSRGSLHKVYEAMEAKGLRTGFNCLFSGAPGTGKTETVYQLARRTGRKLLEADVASLRNCYVGETEKNVRNLFRDYRYACDENEFTPILLFNEADAIFGTRVEGAAKAVDRMENSVQNILLQEMEDFNGILIATTNLDKNLDPAFERRFLYKLRFSKPECETRQRIWKSQFPELSDAEARQIAEEFAFCGGQIENVLRKYTVDSILSGSEGGFPKIRQYCLEEGGGKSAAILSAPFAFEMLIPCGGKRARS